MQSKKRLMRTERQLAALLYRDFQATRRRSSRWRCGDDQPSPTAANLVRELASVRTRAKVAPLPLARPVLGVFASAGQVIALGIGRHWGDGGAAGVRLDASTKWRSPLNIRQVRCNL
jgi:hypothetical protein